MLLSRTGWALVVAAGLCSAQFPGQYPPGQYPGSQAPLPRPPFPGRGKKTTGAKKPPSPKEVLQQFRGTIASVDKDKLTIHAADTRVITFQLSKDTKILRNDKESGPDALQPGLEAAIEARENEEGFFFAVTVTLKDPPAAPAPSATKPVEPEKSQPQTTAATTAAPETGPDVPKLRRGKPAPRPRTPEEEADAVAEAAAAATAPPALAASSPTAPAPDPFLDKAREVAGAFTESLPNYLCNQFTARYLSEGRPVNWQPLDVVSAAVAYQDGVESYHDIRINNKPVKGPIDEISGSSSRGEFGSTLRDLFSPATAAEFRKVRESTASGRTAVIYDFQVDQPNSHWRTVMAGQSVQPAYKGSVWIDKRTARVLRIEMQARQVPASFPLDTIEWVVDYSFTRIGGQEYLVPVQAENLACWRGTGRCARNALDFRNYRRFTSESQISTSDSTVSFEAEEPRVPAGKKQ